MGDMGAYATQNGAGRVSRDFLGLSCCPGRNRKCKDREAGPGPSMENELLLGPQNLQWAPRGL